MALPVALIKPAVRILPPVMLAADVIVPVALINPAVVTLPPARLPVAVTNPPVSMLPPCMLPVALKLVPVAAPILGVVKLAPALTMMLPSLSKAVVLLSTLAENTVPIRLRPAAVLAE